MPDDQDDQQTAADQSASRTQASEETSKSVSFDVEGDVPAVAQPKSMACWATVTTMNMSWKNQQSYAIETAMDSLGSDFRKNFDDNTSLAPDRVQDLSNAIGMKVEYQRCETPDSILQLLKNFGPLRRRRSIDQLRGTCSYRSWTVWGWWSGAALLFAKKGFRKVRGYRHLHQLTTSLKNQILDSSKIAA